MFPSIRGWTLLWVSSVDEAGVRSHAVLSLRKISEKQQFTLVFISQTNWSLDHKPVTETQTQMENTDGTDVMRL